MNGKLPQRKPATGAISHLLLLLYNPIIIIHCAMYNTVKSCFNPNKRRLKLIKYSVVDAQLMTYFINRNIFRHLKLEIALAIPALNE